MFKDRCTVNVPGTYLYYAKTINLGKTVLVPDLYKNAIFPDTGTLVQKVQHTKSKKDQRPKYVRKYYSKMCYAH
jgi:hypothetical protein